MSAHTPGPWRADDRSTVYSEDGRCIALVFGGNNSWEPGCGCPANARLIAAAPEMKDALKNLLVTWDNPNKRPGWIKRFSDAKQQAHAAIAAAEGRAE